MIWKQLHTKNKKLIGLYMASLEHEMLTYDQRLKLVTEIGRLNLQNEYIDNMTVEDYYQELHNYKYQENSSINGTTHKNKIQLQTA